LETIHPEMMRPFRHAEHEAFFWRRDQGRGALLLHGFPGSPAEMRGLGQVLYDSGWSVHAPLLPGFGPAIETLVSRTHREWLDAAAQALETLRKSHDEVLLAGNSMGGALALALARSAEASGLILAAPFTRLASPWQRCVWPLVCRFVSQFRPFEHADMTSPEIRRLARRIFDDADVTDPAVQSFIRNITVPTRAIDQVRRVGKLALQAAPNLRMPALIMQGRADRVVAPKTTRALAGRMGVRPQYCEFNTGHDLIETDGPSWPQVEKRVKEFVDSLLSR
jgi:carboxylesterase